MKKVPSVPLQGIDQDIERLIRHVLDPDSQVSAAIVNSVVYGYRLLDRPKAGCVGTIARIPEPNFSERIYQCRPRLSACPKDLKPFWNSADDSTAVRNSGHASRSIFFSSAVDTRCDRLLPFRWRTTSTKQYRRRMRPTSSVSCKCTASRKD